MRRRTFVIAALSAAAAPSPRTTAKAEERVRKLAIVALGGSVNFMREDGPPWWRAFFNELRGRGYVEGRNLVIERRTAHGLAPSRWPELVREVVSLKPDVIVAFTFALADEFKTVTATIPIVANVLDPIEYGLVKSLARPEANVTGVAADVGPVILGKQLDFLISAAPQIKQVAVFSARRTHAMAALQAAGEKAGVIVREVPFRRTLPEDYEAAFEAMRRDGAQGLIVVDGVQHGGSTRIIAMLAARHGLPLISSWRNLTELGGLMSYGVDVSQLGSRAASHVARLLDGAKPGDLPIEQPTKFEFVVNLKTAQALGLTLPASILAQADEVIE